MACLHHSEHIQCGKQPEETGWKLSGLCHCTGAASSKAQPGHPLLASAISLTAREKPEIDAYVDP